MDITYGRIQSLMKDRGLTEYKLCVATGIRKSLFTDWRAGRSKPNADTIKKIAVYLKVSTDFLLGRVNDPGSIIINSARQNFFDDPGATSAMRIEVQREEYYNALYTLNLVDSTGGIKHNLLFDLVYTIRDLDNDSLMKIYEYAQFIREQAGKPKYDPPKR